MHQSPPKYQQLKKFIKDYITQNHLKPDDKIYSDNELADKFSISRHTVRQAIGELINEGWLYRIQGKGTFVAASIVTQKRKTNNIGVVTTYLNDYIFPSIIKGIDNVLSSNGYSIVLGCTNNEVEKEAICINNMITQDVDGIIIEATKSALPNSNLELYRELGKREIPYIFINGYYSDLNASYVIENDELGGYLAAMHLIGLGHKSIGGVFKVDDIQGHGRYKGFVKAHRENTIPIREQAVVWFSTEDKDTLFSEEYEKNFLKRIEGCTALVCYNDQISLKILDVLRRNNIKVPDNLSLVSFDDSDLAEATEIKLTTVAHPREKLGEKAAELLLLMMKEGKGNIHEVIKPSLIIRQSTMSQGIVL